MNYTKEQVERGRALVNKQSSTQWELGDLTLEALPKGPQGKDVGARKLLEEFAEEIGCAFTTLRNYRLVASAYPKNVRTDKSPWEAHRILAGQDDALKLLAEGISSSEAQRIRAERLPKKKINPGVELVGYAFTLREALFDPEFEIESEFYNEIVDVIDELYAAVHAQAEEVA